MMRSGARIGLGFAAVLAAAANFTACGSTNDSKVAGGASAAAGTSSTGTAASSSGGSLNVDTDGGPGVNNFDGGACAADISTATLAPLDIYIMLDTSGSMLEVTATNVSKWDAVKSALETFLKDDASAGIGVGLQYFPLPKPNAPTSCTKDADCTGDTGPCFTKWCYKAAAQIGTVPCETNADCELETNTGAMNYGPCTTVAFCSQNTEYICQQPGQACTPTAATGPLGNCTAMPPNQCEHTASCDTTMYSTPDQPIAALPGSAAALTASIDAKMPDGQTPTGPALTGALTQASTWGKAHPDHRVVVLLATDGLPTECTPTDITQVGAIAAQGVAATPSISTFVIGVFGPDDVTAMAPANLDTIASDGGTKNAFIVDTTKDVTTQFLAALDAIRSGTIDCTFQIPKPKNGDAVEFADVNVQVTTGGALSTIYYVKRQSQCDATTGGWYYDQDPASATPTQIIACPATCALIQGSKDASVDIAVGCQPSVVK
jgi:hypothetical protein